MPGVKLTYDDLVRMPEDGLRHELIDGEHYVTPRPRPRHQRVVSNLHHALENHVRAHDFGWIFTEPGLVMDTLNAVSPDLIFLTNEQVGQMDMDADISAAPALAIEVSSPSSWRYDQTIKLAFYEAIGVAEYWFIDVMPSTVSIYRRMATGQPFAGPTVLRDQGTAVTSPILPGLQLRLSDIFDMRRRRRA